MREIRHGKAMLIVPGEEDARSAGSFFKNPVVPQSFFEELSARLRCRGLQLPSYPADDGCRKLPAAWLVEHAGFAKGYVKGRRAFRESTRWRSSIAAAPRRGHLALKDEIQARVQEEFGIELQPEPVFVGF